MILVVNHTWTAFYDLVGFNNIYDELLLIMTLWVGLTPNNWRPYWNWQQMHNEFFSDFAVNWLPSISPLCCGHMVAEAWYITMKVLQGQRTKSNSCDLMLSQIYKLLVITLAHIKVRFRNLNKLRALHCEWYNVLCFIKDQMTAYACNIYTKYRPHGEINPESMLPSDDITRSCILPFYI